MPELRGSEIIADYLEAESVPYVFGLCGHGNVGMLDTLRDRTAIKTISVHHEAVAGFMADAYFRLQGRPVATLTSCGPGSAQLPVALAAALMDASAFLAITGNVSTDQFNRGPFQESGYHYQADFPTAVRPFVKRSFQATRPEQLPIMLRQGFHLMTSGRPGPVHLDVPLDVFVERACVTIPDPQAWRTGTSAEVAVAAEQIEKCVDLVRCARRPLLLVGSRAAEASEEITRLVTELGIPVAWTPDGKGVVDARHALALGETGRNGALPANLAARDADVIVAICARFDDRATSSWLPGVSFEIPPTRLIQVEVDASELARNFPVHLGLTATPRVFSGQLLDEVRRQGIAGQSAPQKDWRQVVAGYKAQWVAETDVASVQRTQPMHPQWLLSEVRRVFPDHGVLLADVGVHHNWIVQAWPTYQPGTLLQSWGYAAMGFGLGGALGAALAAPDRPVLAIAGDGGFLMYPGVVATAVEYQLPVVWLVWNNGGFISIRDIQRGYFGRGREYATEFRGHSGEAYSADYAAMARAMGATGFTVSDPGDLAEMVESAFATGGPCVLDVAVDGEIAPVATGSWTLSPLPHPEPVLLQSVPRVR